MAARLITLLAVLALVAAAACGGDDSGSGPDADPDNGNGDNGNGDNGNGDNGNGDNGNGAIGDGDDCPTYKMECEIEGEPQCIPGAIDPDNCGDCGVTCEDGEACSGGECVAVDGGEGDPVACPDFKDAEIEVCDRKCVDTNWDDQNCGGCADDGGEVCDDGEGCVFGTCREAIGSDSSDDVAECDFGDPIFFPGGDNGDNGDNGDQCAGDVAQTTFGFGICTCDSLSFGHEVFVDGFDSATGPYVPLGRGGGIGANQSIASATTNPGLTATGTVWATGEDVEEDDDALLVAHSSSIGENLYCGAGVHLDPNVGTVDIGNDGFVMGGFGTSGDVNFGGTLHVPYDTEDVPETVSAETVVEDGDLQVRRACADCDDPLDIESIVNAASDSDFNNNQDIDLDPDALEGGGNVRLDLPCGHYYLTGISTEADVTIVAHGRTALYVDGDIVTEPGANLSIVPAEGAELDVLVKGDVHVAQAPAEFGSPNYPAMFRLYVGGPTGFVADQRIGIGGFVYVLPGEFVMNIQSLEVFGGIYAQNYVTANQRTAIHFDRRILQVGEECPGEPPDDPDRCIPLGEECEESSECCTPLQCLSGVCREGVVIE